MTHIWNEKPKPIIKINGDYFHSVPSGSIYDRQQMDAWLEEKVKPALEKAEKWDRYLESIKDSIPHVSLADYEILEDKLEAIKNYLKEEKMVIYDPYNRYSAQIITHTQGMLLLGKLLEILEGEDLQSIGDKTQ